MTRSLLGLLAVIAVQPIALVSAQPAERSARWGLTASVTPRWSAAPQVGNYAGADQYDISGSEFTIGFVRGRDYSGDWGVSFVWKGVSEGSTSRFGTNQFCVGENCVEEGTTVVAKNVSMLGVEAHDFLSLVRIGQRVQIGLNVAAGVLRVRGKAEKTERYAGFELDAGAGRVDLVQKVRVSEVGGGQIFTTAKDVENVPSAKLELGVGFVFTRSLKARISGGIAFPGYQVFSASVVYLFGRPGPQSIFH